jgi:hypothetical protein
VGSNIKAVVGRAGDKRFEGRPQLEEDSSRNGKSNSTQASFKPNGIDENHFFSLFGTLSFLLLCFFVVVLKYKCC